MIVMIAGLVLFIGIHLVPTAPALRARLVAQVGDKPYRGLFALISVLGLVLIIAGYHMRPEGTQLFAPLAGARALAPALVTIAFVLFAAANMKTHIRSIVRHPMLIGLLLWSGVHLLANGDLTGTLLFGSFFIYSIIAIASAVRRGTVKAFTPEWKHDLIAVGAGLIIAYLTMRFHPVIFGTAPVA
jgi:uncharacterized membrane protein